MAKQVVVIAVEGLGTQLLSPYGNSWSGTKALSSIAANSIVANQFWLESLHPNQYYAKLLGVCDGNANLLPDRIGQPALQMKWLCDRVAALPPASVNIPWERREPQPNRGEEILDTALGQQFESVLRWFANASDTDDQLLWVHSGGLAHPWDAPQELRESFREEEDIEAALGIETPELYLDADSDPDIATAWSQAAAAQIVLLDQCLYAINEAIEERGWQDSCLLIITSLGGYALGEHQYIGWQQRDLWSETLRVPCILRPGRQLPITLHRHELYQPIALIPTIRTWLAEQVIDPTSNATSGDCGLLDFGGPMLPENWPVNRSLAVARDGDKTLVAMPHWLFRQTELEGSWQIFMQPDDHWCINDISTRVPDILEAWLEYWPQLHNSLISGNDSAIPTLPKILIERSY